MGVLILDVDLGLYVGVGWAIMTVMLRLQKPKVGAIGRLPGTDIYRRTDVYKTVRTEMFSVDSKPSDWSVDWLFDRLIDWWIYHQLIDWLMIDRSVDWLID